LFDSFPYHPLAADFHNFTATKLNSPNPDYVFDIRKGGVDVNGSTARFKTVNSVEGDLSEEQQADFKKNYTIGEVNSG